MGKWKSVFYVAATYIGTVVGAGFASGQEILQFFTVHGVWGVAAILVSTFLFIWIGCKIMDIAREEQCFSYKEFNVHLFGKKLGWLFNGMTLIVLFGTTGVMLSGAGAIFEERFGIAPQIGVIMTIALCLFVMKKGMLGVMWVNSLVVPMMLVFTVILASRLTAGEWGQYPVIAQDGNWLISGVLYAGFNLAMAQAVLVPMGQECGDNSIIKWGGLLGGLALGMMLLTNHLALWSDYQNIRMLDIPIARLISAYGSGMAILFLLVVYGEIFTTVIGNVFGMARQLQSTWNISPFTGSALILLGSFLLTQWGFRSLVSSLYPAFGIIGLAFMARIAVNRFRLRQ